MPVPYVKIDDARFSTHSTYNREKGIAQSDCFIMLNRGAISPDI